MDILNYHKKLVESYKTYIQSFINIKDPKILEFVENEIDKKKLWPEPLVQFNPTFESARPISDLCDEGILHKEFKNIFSSVRSLYKHQEEAIRIGAAGKEFVVTSGTGSGKSLTYITTVFNHVLNHQSAVNDKIIAVVVYPMNALINSQFKEIEKFKLAYEEKYDKPFPVTFGQFTGQESEEQRDKLRSNPPHILLTNYMMLELLMTRSGRDVDIRQNFLENLKYLVFDELHTYRGRQGSDVSLLIRRIKASASHPVICIGTSATMVSGDNTTLLEQKTKVAEVASTIFGSPIESAQVVNEYLVRSIGNGISPSEADLKLALAKAIDKSMPEEQFEKHPVANWIEEQIALELKEGVLVRRKPVELTKMAEMLAENTNTSIKDALNYLVQLLEWANTLNTRVNKKQNYLPFKIHQFIAQTGSVYSTLGDQTSRDLYLDAGLYAGEKDKKLYPIVFSRASGHEFICVKLNHKDSTILQREFYDVVDDDDNSDIQEGYIFIDHAENDDVIWNFDRDISDLPDTWFSPPRKDGTRKLKAEKEGRLPKRIYFNRQGNFSFTENIGFEGWYISSPLMFDPTSGTIFDSQTAEWTKVMKLGGEGRSTATTVLSFETISQLYKFGISYEKQKLLSFTDNRQDASLQAGHFNDFIKAGQLRAAVARALSIHKTLDYSDISNKVFECLNIEQDQYAIQSASFPGQKKENEDAFKDFITYRLLFDLMRSWRVVMPNLEQCALLTIEYKYLADNVKDDALWQGNDFLYSLTSDERYELLHQIFDFLRKSYALSYSMLHPATLVSNAKKIKEKLKSPWTLDKNEKLQMPNHIRIEKLASKYTELYSESAGYTSVFGRYLRRKASVHGHEIKNRQQYTDFTYDLLNFLAKAGWLSINSAESDDGNQVNIYQLKVDYIIWKEGDGKKMVPDLIKTRAYRPQDLKPNKYFQQFYMTDFQQLKTIEGREHTGQINSEDRKTREEKFRKGEISTLFCSPTMELGIDISDLSIVHMRNVPPSPSNYAQRSGRAGRSGQAALVLVYCSNFSAHDRHYFKHSTQMVAGTVTAPRMDLINQELLLSHLHATILMRKSLQSLNNSLGDLVNIYDLDNLPLKSEIADVLKISDQEKASILETFKKVLNDSYFSNELTRRKPSWFTDAWILQTIDSFQLSFDQALNRWRKLYRSAQRQITAATSIIDNRIYADNSEKKKEAYKSLKQAERQRDLLLNDSTDGKSKLKDQSEFYPYRYFASEGFLPGYNFTRLPIRSFMETESEGGEFISRARFVALSEFGPRNVIYHDGAKYRVDRMMLTEAELKLEKAKICPKTGYFLYGDEYGYEVDPIIHEELQLDTQKHIHTTLIEMAETRAYELQRITCQEEERTKKGYDIQTYFAVDGGFENTVEGKVSIADEKLLHIHYFPSCRIFRLNLKWRSSRENGFTINLNTGYWQSQKQKEEKIKAGEAENLKEVKLFTSDTSNALYIQPIKALNLGSNGVITLMFAIKQAFENYFQIESNEIGTTIMGDEESPNILIYESAEGSLGVLSQIMDNPAVYKEIMLEAYRICFYKNGKEEEGDVLPATYDDLLSYYNQYYHHLIDRNLIRAALRNLMESSVEILANKSFDSYEQQYSFLQGARDKNSSTEEDFLKYLYKKGLKLPDKAQPVINDLYVKPDFLYYPNICIFCDGLPHDDPSTKNSDLEKRAALRNSGFQVVSWYYRDSLDDLVARRSDIFTKVKEK